MNPYHGHHRPSRPKLRLFGLISVVLSVIFGVAAMAAPTASATDVESNPDFIFLAFCDGAMFENTGNVDLVITANGTPYLRAPGEQTETVPYNEANQVDYTVEFGEQVVGSGTVNRPAQYCDVSNISVSASVQFDCSEVPVSGVINATGLSELDGVDVRLGTDGPIVSVWGFEGSTATLDAATLAQVQSFTGWYWETGSGEINGTFDPSLEYDTDCGAGDEDNDGVPDDQDSCPGTANGVSVGSDGCPVEDKVCDGEKVNLDGTQPSVVISAPAGYLISAYCVKAGSANQGDGPEYVTVNPPKESVTITHSTGKGISHYAVTYVKKEATTTTIPPTTTPVTTTPVTTTPVTTTPVTTTPVTTTPVTTTPTTSATTVPFTPNSPLPSTGGDGSQDYSGPLWILSAVFGAIALGGFLRRRFARVS